MLSNVFGHLYLNKCSRVNKIGSIDSIHDVMLSTRRKNKQTIFESKNQGYSETRTA